MRLQTDRACSVFYDFRETDIFRCTQDSRVILQYDAILDNRNTRRNTISTVFLEDRSGIDNIVNIPFTRLAHGICQRRRLFVDAAGLSVHVCLVVIAIQHLDFIHVLQEDAAVAASLACAGDVFRYAPFDMQLEVLEFLFCQDVAFLLVYSENAVFYDPFGGAALSVLPSGKVFSVKQDDGIGRGAVCLDVTRSDYFRLRSPVFRHSRFHFFLFGVLFLRACTDTSCTSQCCQSSLHCNAFVHGLNCFIYRFRIYCLQR